MLLISTAFENVETPATTSSSTSNCPSISKPPLASIVVNVAIPATLSWSRFAPPTTSRRLFASTSDENVATPATLRSST